MLLLTISMLLAYVAVDLSFFDFRLEEHCCFKVKIKRQTS